MSPLWTKAVGGLLVTEVLGLALVGGGAWLSGHAGAGSWVRALFGGLGLLLGAGGLFGVLMLYTLKVGYPAAVTAGLPEAVSWWLSALGFVAFTAALTLIINGGPVYLSRLGQPVPGQVQAVRCPDPTPDGTCSPTFRILRLDNEQDLGWYGCLGHALQPGDRVTLRRDPRGWLAPTIQDCGADRTIGDIAAWTLLGCAAGGPLLMAGGLLATARRRRYRGW